MMDSRIAMVGGPFRRDGSAGVAYARGYSASRTPVDCVRRV